MFIKNNITVKIKITKLIIAAGNIINVSNCVKSESVPITIPEKKAIPIRKILLISADSSFALINQIEKH